MLGQIGAAVGTFTALIWFAVNVTPAAIELAGTSPVDFGVPDVLAWVLVIAATTVATIWLERGGYQRLGASPRSGRSIAWLALLVVPVCFLPSAIVSVRLVATPVVPHVYFAGCVIVAAWLVRFDGLDRQPFRLAAVLALVGAACVFALDVFAASLPVSTDLLVVTVAIGWQLLVFSPFFVSEPTLERLYEARTG